ncbi:MAG: hypothetical protein ACAI35_18055 [Candidatus Methylacidiphilales bacterium]|nr:hypothetical protein [Candidatus Methylacidiphilales bacterium]
MTKFTSYLNPGSWRWRSVVSLFAICLTILLVGQVSMSAATCPDCRGNGKVMVKRPDPGCNGTGHVIVSRHPTRYAKHVPCRGTGYLVSWVQCRTCHGSGQIVRQGKIRCPRCNGVGIRNNTTCTTCGGKGWIWASRR